MTQRLAPQAGLQRRIIFALAADPARSIVSLAGRIGATRPAVSRSLQTLVRLGLVEANGRSWSLTAEGRVEAAGSRSQLSPSIERAIARQTRDEHRFGLTLTSLARIGANSIGAKSSLGAGLAGMTKTADLLGAIGAKSSLGAGLAGMTKTADLLGAIGAKSSLGAGLAGINRVGMLGAIGKARADVQGSLILQVAALDRPSAWWSSMIADNLGITARVAADMAAMGESLLAGSHLTKTRSDGIQRAAGRIVSAHYDLLGESMRRYLIDRALPEAATAIVTPTLTTAAFTGAVRNLVVRSEGSRDSADLLLDAVLDLAVQLEGLGAHSTARDLKASWDVLKLRRPGWPKAGAHLMRETLRETLDELAPPSRVPRDERGFVTKRAQVLWIVADDRTLAIWVEATASSVGKLHSFLSAEAKNAGDPRIGWQGFIGLLETLTGLVRTLVDQASRRERH